MLIPSWLTAAAWFIFLIVVYWPIYQLLVDAFGSNGQATVLVSLDDFSLTQIQYELLSHSLLLASGATVLALVIGIPFAICIQRTTMWGSKFFGWAYFIPLLIPPYMQAIIWNQALATGGWASQILTVLHLDTISIEARNLGSATVILAFSYFPFVTLLTVSGLTNMDESYEEAALLVANRFKTLFTITLPMIMPQILAGSIFVFVFSIIDFGVSDILRVRTYPVEIFIEYSAMYNERAAIFLAVPLLIITSILITTAFWLLKDKSFVNFYSNTAKFSLSNSAYLNSIAFCFCFIVFLFTAIVPIISLIDISEPLASSRKPLFSSLDNIGFSLLIAIVASITMVMLATILAYSVLNSSGIKKLVLDYLTQLPFAFPPILLGIGLTKIWNQPLTDWLYSSSFMIVIGYIAHLISFVIRIIYAGMQKIPSCFIEAGLLTCNQKWKVVTTIVLPLLKGSLLTAFIMGFVFSLADLGTTLLIMPPGSETMPIIIYNYLHYGAPNLVAVFCLTLLFFQYFVCVVCNPSKPRMVG